jgi:microsomal dipeptidase-like Zn-dependent dipeptidase
VIEVNELPSFVKSTKMGMGEKSTVENLLDHIEYLRELGEEHVGVGLDFIENVSLEEHKGLKA